MSRPCSANGEPDETSPLLPKSTDLYRVTSPIDGGAGIAPEGAHHTNWVENSANDEESSSNDIENQNGDDRRSKQFQGLPEVKKRMKFILPAVAVGIFLAAADQTIIFSSYGTIGTDLDALNKTSWIATAYLLTLTCFQPLYGKLSDIFGRKQCLIFSYIVFGFGCLACGLARNIDELIAARVLAGIGGGGMTTVVSILLSDVVTLRERGKWQGYLNLIYATGAAVGAPVGGIMADTIGWRWAFNFQPPLCLVSIIAVSLALKLPKRSSGNWKDKIRRIDFLGAFFLICGVIALLIALDRGSNVAWKDVYTLTSLGVSLPLFALFVLVELKVAAEPFAPGHIIFDKALLAGYLCNFFSFAGWLAALFYIPLHFQVVNGLSATESSLRLIPSVVCGVCGSLFGGFHMQKTGKYYWITVICYSTLTLGLTVIFLFSGVENDLQSMIGMIVGMCICGFSNGIGVTTALIALIANSNYEEQSLVTATSYLFRALGGVSGVSISASVANQALRTGLAKKLGSDGDAAELAERVRQSLSYIKTLEHAVRHIVRSCYAMSTRSALGLEIALVSGAAVSAWFLREKSLS